MNCKRGAWLLAAALLVALFGGCAENGGKSEISVPTVEALDTADMFTQRDTTVPTATDAVTVMLKDDASTASAAGVS